MECIELFAGSRRVAWNGECLTLFVVLKGNHCCQAGRLNSWERANPPDQLIVEGPALCFGVAEFTGIKPYVQHILRIKSEVGMLSVPHAAHKKASDNQQCQ